MKLIANVVVTRRQHGGYGSSRAQRASLTIGKLPGTQDLCVLYQTVQNRLGTKYKIVGNVECLFTRCVGEGKATIRFINPAHDVSIKCDDNLLLKSFLQTLGQALNNKLPLTSLRLSTLNQTAVVIPKPKSVLKIREKSDYPVLSGFPRTLQQLYVNDIQVKIFDVRILRLQQLKVLDLSGNLLTKLPEALGDLPLLTTLVLSHNELGQATEQDANWPWLNNTRLASTLNVLDISSNKLTELPRNLRNMQALVRLNVSGNSLRSLFPGIGLLKKLRYLSASQNHLSCLPGSIQGLKLDVLDVSSNFWEIIKLHMVEIKPYTMPSLVEMAAQCIVNQRLRYHPSDIPKRVTNYLYEANFCNCGSACFESAGQYYEHSTLKQIADNVICDVNRFNTMCLLQSSFCSRQCRPVFTSMAVTTLNPFGPG